MVEVSYRWVREQTPAAGSEIPAAGQPKPKDTRAGAAAPAAGTAGAVTTTEPPKAARPGEQQVRVASVERRGKDERAAKAGLLVEVNRQKSRAHEGCKREHESFGDCVSTKLSAKSATIQSLGFSARAKVEEALIEECRLQLAQHCPQRARLGPQPGLGLTPPRGRAPEGRGLPRVRALKRPLGPPQTRLKP